VIISPLAAGELVEDDVALGLAEPLEDDLLGRLGVDAPEVLGVELLGLDELAHPGVGLVLASLIHRELGERVLDLVDDVLRPEHSDLAGLRIDADVNVLVAFGPPIRGLDGFLDRPDQLLAGDLLLGVELEEGAHEITTHAAPPALSVFAATHKRNVGVTHVTRRPFTIGRRVYTGPPRASNVGRAQDAP
jgi:hypothetical protein